MIILKFCTTENLFKDIKMMKGLILLYVPIEAPILVWAFEEMLFAKLQLRFCQKEERKKYSIWNLIGSKKQFKLQF